MLAVMFNPTHQSLVICTRCRRSPACLCWLHRTTHSLDGIDARISTNGPQDIAFSPIDKAPHLFFFLPSHQEHPFLATIKGASPAYIYIIYYVCIYITRRTAIRLSKPSDTARERDFQASSHVALAVRCPDWLSVAAHLQVSSCSAQPASDFYPVSRSAVLFLYSHLLFVSR